MFQKGYKQTEEQKKKIGLANSISLKGKKHSEETKRKMSESGKGKHFYWLGKKRDDEFRRKIAKAHKGFKHSKESRIKMSEHHKLNGYEFQKGHKGYWKGKKNLGVSESNKRRIGEKNYQWKGGIAPINQKIRGSLEYKLWQDSVWNRDSNYCQKCGENRIKKLVAHHILNFSEYLELRFAIDNGITFCKDCHEEFHKKFGKRNNTKKQLEEFLK